MTFISEDMKKAMNKAYEKAGDNAYFGNGFYAGWLAHAKKMEEPRQCKIITEVDDTFADSTEIYYKCGNCQEPLWGMSRKENYCDNCGYKFIKGE